MASSDGGVTFSTSVPFNDDADTQTQWDYAAPRMVVSQGSADGRVQGGQLNLVFSNYTNSAVEFDRMQTGGSGAVFTGAGGGITDASPPLPLKPGQAGPNPSRPQGPDIYTIPGVLIADPNFNVTDLDVTLNIHDLQSTSQLLVQLVAPNGQMINLVENRLDVFAAVRPAPTGRSASRGRTWALSGPSTWALSSTTRRIVISTIRLPLPLTSHTSSPKPARWPGC